MPVLFVGISNFIKNFSNYIIDIIKTMWYTIP